VGGAASQLARKLKKKYKSAPKLSPRFTAEDRKPSSGSDKQKKQESTKKENNKPNLHLATKEDLMQELEKRLDEERDAQVEEEDDDDAEFEHSWTPGDFPEKVTIIGGGPAGISAAIYAARAGLTPVVVCPPMGGQLQGKGVDVENYPGLPAETGPGLIAAMRQQAADFGAVFEAELVTKIDASTSPFTVHTNSSTITTHSIIVATGAESKWLNVPGEWELRGGGVSSCATCDGAIFRGKDVVVVGGGDAAMEDALVLARTSKSVTVVHRRDTFRASKVLAQRVMEHPRITIKWDSIVKEIVGGEPAQNNEDTDKEKVDLDEPVTKVVKSVVLEHVETKEETRLAVDAVFVAIGHTPSTSFLEGIVEFEEDHPGYVKVFDHSTRTSVPGIFAAGDVADSIYRQAITSAGSGAAAALDAERWLSEEGLGNEAEELEAELMAELMNSDEKIDISYNAYDDAGGRVEGMKESIAAEL
jgi:thioredoxin reductase